MKASILSLVIVGAILIVFGILSLIFNHFMMGVGMALCPSCNGSYISYLFLAGIALLAGGGGLITIAILKDKKKQ